MVWPSAHSSTRLDDHSQHGAQSKVCIRYITAHGDHSVPAQRILVEDRREEIELLPHRRPCLLALRANKPDGGRARSAVSEVGLTTFGQALMGQGDENGEERLDEDVLDVVDEQRLECPRPLWEDGTGGIRCLEVVGDIIGIGEYDRRMAGPHWIHYGG